MAELGREMSSQELTYWMAYYMVEPFGDQRDDIRMGAVCASIYNTTPMKTTRTYNPNDFKMPTFANRDDRKRDQDPDKMADQWFARHKKVYGGRDGSV